MGGTQVVGEVGLVSMTSMGRVWAVLSDRVKQFLARARATASAQPSPEPAGRVRFAEVSLPDTGEGNDVGQLRCDGSLLHVFRKSKQVLS